MKECYKDYFKNSYELSKYWNDNKYQWVSNDFFDISTYDKDLDEKYGKIIIEVIEAIYNRKTFEYIKDYKNNYENYIIVVNLIKHWLEYGGSIRGAWFYYNKVKLSYINHEFVLTEEFVQSLIEFVKEEE